MEQISVLVADDDREIVESIAIFLKAENYDVIKAYNGREALEKARENSVQLIILDIMMPEMDGIRTLLKLREEKICRLFCFLPNRRTATKFSDLPPARTIT